jgi:protein TonB
LKGSWSYGGATKDCWNQGKKLGAETIKGDPDAVLSVAPVGNGPKQQVVEEDNQIYNNAGIEVKPEFPGGMDKFYGYVSKNYRAPEEEGLKGKVYVTFSWKDGSLTDIKVWDGLRNRKEAIRVLQKCQDGIWSAKW